MADLVVELYGTRVGTLAGDWRTFDFHADPAAVDRFGLDSPVLSVATPLAIRPSRGAKARRQGVFAELLPEGRMLERLAQEARVPTYDVIGMLRCYGRDIAGALQIWDPGAPGEPRTPSLTPVTHREIGDLLRRVSDFPLANRDSSGKTSLAGVQDKIVLAQTSDGWSRALDGHPSSHILKPASSQYTTMIFDEEYGARLSRAVGLTSFDTWLETFDGEVALVIERYDRDPRLPGGRLQQEDFNQALGARGIQKYQRHGGRVSLAAIARTVNHWAGQADLHRLLRMVTLAVVVGNLDLHAKNLSLLHPPDGSTTLAPAYDVVPLTHLDTDGELALAINGEYRHAAITRDHLVREAHSWGLRDPQPIITDTAEKLRDTARREAPDPRAHPRLADDVAGFAMRLLDGQPVGRILGGTPLFQRLGTGRALPAT
ncbi:type II toxin-antitoxin system HipA family toxin [Salana multivorans]